MSGEIEVHWKTVDNTAKSGVDYQGAKGKILFNDQQVWGFICTICEILTRQTCYVKYYINIQSITIYSLLETSHLKF